MSAVVTENARPERVKPKYKPAIGPRLKKLYAIVMLLIALMGANSAYLAGMTFWEWVQATPYQNTFTMWMILGHVGLGMLLIVPLVLFGVIHMLNTRKRKNRRAVRVGYALFIVAITLLVTGVLLVRVVGFFDLKNPLARSVVYWLHVASPVVALWLYWLHRLAGPKIRWRVGGIYLAVVGALVVGMLFSHSQDPRAWNVTGPKEGEQYFHPSLARTTNGKFIPAKALMMDQYCIKCHQDVHADWKQSAHHFSSFNNPAYLASVRETRHVSLKRDGNVKASRWCAGCHDPVPFFSGAFDDPKFDDVKHPTAHAGITCTSCHAITNINSTRGNGDYTIEEPLHYPFAYSDNKILQWINNQLVKAKPAFHKRTFLKPLHKTTEFCSVCHKVNLPSELTKYDGFLRGQNHHDSFLLSGVSGGSARSFYYPPKAESNCNRCHMPLKPSSDFGAKTSVGSSEPSVHNHLFLGANTGIAWLKNQPDAVRAHREFLENCMRVDIFGLKEDGTISGKLHAPLRPQIPNLKPGKSYLLETVVRTLTLGHHFTQGTSDSNEVWLEVLVTSGGRTLAHHGRLDEQGRVDSWAHFINSYLLDRDGHKIDRRNAQDIFVPLYSHQIPPGAAQTVHYALNVPPTVSEPVTVTVKIQYRKFNQAYMDFVARTAKEGDLPLRGKERGKPYRNQLPVVTIAQDSITFPVDGADNATVKNPVPRIPKWQRWNDYGIGLLLKTKEGQSVEPTQAAAAFREVEKLGRYDGPLNLVRVLLQQKGRATMTEAVAVINRAAKFTNPAPPPWTLAYLRGQVLRRQGRFRDAAENFRSVLSKPTSEMKQRGFDFRNDYIVINTLGETLRELSRVELRKENAAEAKKLREEAVDWFLKTLSLDAENETAHKNLAELYQLLGEQKLAEKHADLSRRYDIDESRGSRAKSLARAYHVQPGFAAGLGIGAANISELKRQRDPAAIVASEEPVIYQLNRTNPPPNPGRKKKPAEKGIRSRPARPDE
ncbi:MAG: multiheme c-type cytochrome [Planctomycetaceae bacterium]